MPRRAQAEVEGGGLGWGGWGGSAEAMAPAFWASLGVMPSLRAASALGCQKIEILHAAWLTVAKMNAPHALAREF